MHACGDGAGVEEWRGGGEGGGRRVYPPTRLCCKHLNNSAQKISGVLRQSNVIKLIIVR